MSEERQKMRKKCENTAKSDPTWPKNPSLAGIRETLSLLRKERKTQCNLRKPIQVSSITLKPLVQPGLTRVWGRNPRVLFTLRASRRGRLEARACRGEAINLLS